MKQVQVAKRPKPLGVATSARGLFGGDGHPRRAQERRKPSRALEALGGFDHREITNYGDSAGLHQCTQWTEMPGYATMQSWTITRTGRQLELYRDRRLTDRPNSHQRRPHAALTSILLEASELVAPPSLT